MKLFIGDRPVKITDRFRKIDPSAFDLVLDADDVGSIRKLKGKLLIKGLGGENIHTVLGVLDKNRKYTSAVLLTKFSEKIKAAVKKHYKIVEAGGGLVLKNGRFLLMRRLGKWDLPKGKVDRGETPSEGALRETEEECGIHVEIDRKLCITYHTYSANGRKMLKKTHWFMMRCLDDRRMKPQEDEFIEELRWVSKEELKPYLEGAYHAIRLVFKKYFKKNDGLRVKGPSVKTPKIKL